MNKNSLNQEEGACLSTAWLPLYEQMLLKELENGNDSSQLMVGMGD